MEEFRGAPQTLVGGPSAEVPPHGVPAESTTTCVHDVLVLQNCALCLILTKTQCVVLANTQRLILTHAQCQMFTKS